MKIALSYHNEIVIMLYIIQQNHNFVVYFFHPKHINEITIPFVIFFCPKHSNGITTLLCFLAPLLSQLNRESVV